MRKRILMIVPYDNIYPPMNGGMQRCFNIINQLAIHFTLTVIIGQKKAAFLEASTEFPAIADVKVYSTKEHKPEKTFLDILPFKIKQAILYRWYKKEWRGSADGLFLEYYHVLVKLLKTNLFDSVILENLSTVNAVSVIRNHSKVIRIFYDAHNVDSKLALSNGKQIYKHNEGINLEVSLYKSVDAILACSKEDKDDLVAMNRGRLNGFVVPNGVNTDNGLFDEGVRKEAPEFILFCGNLSYRPNIEGLVWFQRSIWPFIKKCFPGLQLLIVGSGQVPDVFSSEADTSFHFTGAVDDVKSWYNKASLAIVPLLSGSGTRLKILEAMSLGLPVVSTSKGAEGIETTDRSIMIADEENEFAQAVIRLLVNKEARIAIQQSARKLAEEKYDWSKIGLSLSQYLN